MSAGESEENSGDVFGEADGGFAAETNDGKPVGHILGGGVGWVGGGKVGDQGVDVGDFSDREVFESREFEQAREQGLVGPVVGTFEEFQFESSHGEGGSAVVSTAIERRWEVELVSVSADWFAAYGPLARNVSSLFETIGGRGNWEEVSGPATRKSAIRWQATRRPGLCSRG